MSVIEKLNNSQVKFSIEFSADKLEEGLKYSFNKSKNMFSLPGFRKGKVPRSLVEKQFGVEVLYDDAFNYLLNEGYPRTVKELGLDVVSKPEFDIEKKPSKEDGVTFSIVVTVKPDVVLGQYKNLTYKKVDTTPTESEIMTEITAAQEKNARIISIEDRPIQNGDIAVINFEGFIDGVPFEGGKGEDFELSIGSHSFIDTFEDQLIGHNIADDIDVTVTFPEDYHVKELAGKEAIFKVEILEIKTKELPELDDELAQDISEFNTLDEYKESIRKTMTQNKEHQAEHDIEDQLLKKAVENATIELPEVMVETQIDQMMQDYEYRLKNQGMSLDLFLQYTGGTKDGLRESMRESAGFNVRARLVLEQIAKDEAFVATEEEIAEEISRIAKGYGIDEERAKTLFAEDDKKGLELDVCVKKSINLLTSTATEEL